MSIPNALCVCAYTYQSILSNLGFAVENTKVFSYQFPSILGIISPIHTTYVLWSVWLGLWIICSKVVDVYLMLYLAILES